MTVGPLILFSSRNRDGQTILLWRQWTGRVGCDRARRVVGAVKIQHYGSVGHGIHIQKTAARIGIALGCQIIEHEEEAFGRITAERSQSKFLAIELEDRRADDWCGSDIPQHVGNVDCFLSVGRLPRSCDYIVHVEREEDQVVETASGRAIEILQTYAGAGASLDDMKA